MEQKCVLWFLDSHVSCHSKDCLQSKAACDKMTRASMKKTSVASIQNIWSCCWYQTCGQNTFLQMCIHYSRATVDSFHMHVTDTHIWLWKTLHWLHFLKIYCSLHRNPCTFNPLTLTKSLKCNDLLYGNLFWEIFRVWACKLTGLALMHFTSLYTR